MALQLESNQLWDCTCLKGLCREQTCRRWAHGSYMSGPLKLPGHTGPSHLTFHSRSRSERRSLALKLVAFLPTLTGRY